MSDQNLPAVPQIHSLEIPVAEFEGEYVRMMIGKLPAINLEMDYGYARGTHLKLELEVRVRSVNVDEVTSGKSKGELKREHRFSIEEAKIIGAYSADDLDPGAGGGLAATGNDIQDDDNDDTDARPEGNEDDREEEEDQGEQRDEPGAGGLARDIDPGF